MGRKAQIAIVAMVVLLIGGSLGAYAVDASHRHTIAPGVRIGGVDVGGMNVARARDAVRQEIVAPLARPIRVRFAGHNYKLDARRLKMKADLDGMVAEALQVSREGGLPTRFWREVTGGEVHHDVLPRLSYSKVAVSKFVSALAKRVDRKPVNASVAPSADSLNPVPGQDGRKLNDDKLRRRIEAEVATPTTHRLVKATAQNVPPAVTTDQVASQYPAYITIDRGAFSLKLWKNLKLVHSYTIAVGQIGLETPAGLYHIQDKAVDPTWNVPNSAWAGDLAGKSIPGGTPLNPLKARWMGIYAGAGIHGTDDLGSLGSAASHGCIRMAIPDVIALYDQVSVGTPVYIG